MILIQTIVNIILIAGLVCLTALILYLWLLVIAYYFVTSRQETAAAIDPKSRFVFVVPAHNEESGITATVQSLLNVSYPRDLFDVVVVADNCTDGTAEQARTAGAECLERRNETLRGKGYVLSHAFTELMSRRYDAFIVIDADSIISSNFLSALDVRLRRGEKVIQAYDGLSNPDASILTYLFQVGNLIENKLYWEPKNDFGLPIILRGNGMCFASEILEKYPWNAFSITEDTEYGLMLINHNVRIHFASDMGVYACQPATLQQAFAQRVRWASGNATLTRGRAVKLIASGVMQNNFALIDIGVALISGSRPLLLVTNIVLFLLAFIIGSKEMAYWSCVVLLAQVLYIGIGVIMNGISKQKFIRLALSPFYLTWLSIVSLLGFAGFHKDRWIRTTRSS